MELYDWNGENAIVNRLFSLNCFTIKPEVLDPMCVWCGVKLLKYTLPYSTQNVINRKLNTFSAFLNKLNQKIKIKIKKHLFSLSIFNF